jgi:Thioredoxin-like
MTWRLIVAQLSALKLTAMQEYYGTMPWLAIPRTSEALQKLPAKFGVMGVPTLIVLDPENGEIITRSGVGAVQSDPTGEGFPWPGYKPSLLSKLMAWLPAVTLGLIVYMASKFFSK